MSSLIWSAGALADVQRLYRFLEPKDKVAAKRAITTIRKAAMWLKTYPQLGRLAVHLGADYRQLSVPFGSEGYVVIYTEKNAAVTVLAVKHQKECSP